MLHAIVGNGTSKKDKMLKIDKRLPQIIIPNNKIQMLLDWWNSDIRFEKEIPHSFNEGYLVVDDMFSSMTVDQDNFKALIKRVAKVLNTTYRNIETQFKIFISNLKTITMYFKFSDGNKLTIETYDLSNKIMSDLECQYGGNEEPEDELSTDFSVGDFPTVDDYVKQINYLNLGLLTSCMWYIATTTRNTKYIYDRRTPIVTGRKKGVVQVSDTKYITTPIYDMSKIRTVHVDKLVSRKKGWTYSHSFQVHGHYRHYRSGKVIFIDPYIKGKDKEFMAQKIIIEPELN